MKRRNRIGVCVECKKRQSIVSRGLCNRCRNNPSIREKYPPKVNMIRKPKELTEEELDRIIAEQMANLPKNFYKGRGPYTAKDL